MNDCKRVGRLIGGCKFEARYDTVSAREPTIHEVFFSQGLGQYKTSPAKRTYVHDVCTRCGATAVRPSLSKLAAALKREPLSPRPTKPE